MIKGGGLYDAYSKQNNIYHTPFEFSLYSYAHTNTDTKQTNK